MGLIQNRHQRLVNVFKTQQQKKPKTLRKIIIKKNEKSISELQDNFTLPIIPMIGVPRGQDRERPKKSEKNTGLKY